MDLKHDDLNEHLNFLALNEFNNRNNYNALKLLLLNQKINPNMISSNNLGVFISLEGWLKKETSLAKKRYLLALRYLKKALGYKKNFLTYCALGDLYLFKNKLKKAEEMYSHALKLERHFAVINNLAVVLYKRKKYNESRNLFYDAMQHCEDCEEKYNIILSYAFACLKSHDSKATSAFFELASKENKEKYNPEVIKLAYMCNEYSFIINNYEKIFDSYVMNKVDYQILYSTLGKGNLPEKMREKRVATNKQNFFLFNRKVDCNKIDFYPKIIFKCTFFDCPVHGISNDKTGDGRLLQNPQ